MKMIQKIISAALAAALFLPSVCAAGEPTIKTCAQEAYEADFREDTKETYSSTLGGEREYLSEEPTGVPMAYYDTYPEVSTTTPQISTYPPMTIVTYSLEIEVPNIKEPSQWYYSDENEFYRDGIKVVLVTYIGNPGYEANREDVTDDAEIYFNETPAEIYNGKPGEYKVEVRAKYDKQLSLTSNTVETVLPVRIFLRGDANLDGNIDLQDAIYIKKIMQQYNPTDEQTWASDMDYNGIVNVLDFNTISDQVLNEIPLDDINVPYVKDSIGTDEKGVKIGDADCIAGDTVDIPLTAVNADSKGCLAVLSYDSPLNIASIGDVSKKSSDGKKTAAVFINSSGGSSLGSISVNVPENTPNGNYSINILVYELDDDGKKADNPIGISGTVTVRSFKAEPFPENGRGVEIGSVKGEPGETVLVPVYIRKLGDVTDVEVKFSYASDAPISFVNIKDSMLYEKITTNIWTAIFLNGYYSWRDGDIIGYIEVTISENAEYGEYPINVNVESLGDSKGSSISYAVGGCGTVTVGKQTSQISVADIVLLQKYLVKSKSGITKKYDLNNDGTINVFDLVLLKRRVLNSIW